jgi:probable HAF family extracellular repeat protein
MRTRIWTCMIAFALLAAMSVADRLAGAELSKKKEVRYTVVKLATLGGTQGAGDGINNRSWVTGLATVDGDQSAHATLWRDGEKTDLGTLGGANSSVIFPSKGENGLVVGVAETGDVQPKGEIFSCAAFFGTPRTGHVCRGFAWRDDAMTGLDPFPGGDNSFAAGVNDRGQIVGWAENGTHDGTCTPPQLLQFRAAIWSDGSIHELSPLGDDATSAATAINESGQVVGISGRCDRARGRFSAEHAVVWDAGSRTPTRLPDLGGVAWNTPTAITHHGDIAGFSDFPGDQGGGLNAHAVLWPRTGGIVDLKVLDGDAISLAFGINDKNQVVGQSIGDAGSRAFLWEEGVLTDLNTVTEDESPFLIFANDINERGEIAGQGCSPCAGETFAVKLIPK